VNSGRLFKPKIVVANSSKLMVCEQLSQLQRLILVMLSEPRCAVLKRRVFNRVVKRLYWGKEGRAPPHVP
jgi:hypothetical protein